MGVPYKIYRIYVPLLSWTAHCIGWCGHYGAMSWWARGHPGLCACRKHKKCLKEGRQIWESIATRKLGESPQLPDIAASETYFRSLITTKQDNFYPSRKNKRKRTSVTLKTLLALKVIANLLIQGFLPQCVRKLPKIANVCRPKTTPLEFPQSCSHVVGTLYSKAHHNNFRLWLSIQYKSCLSKLASQHISSRNALLETCPHPPKEKPITDWCVSNIHHVEETSTMSQYIYIYMMCANGHSFSTFLGMVENLTLARALKGQHGDLQLRGFLVKVTNWITWCHPLRKRLLWPRVLSAQWLDRPIKPSLKSIPKFHKIFANFSQKKMDSRSTMTLLGIHHTPIDPTRPCRCVQPMPIHRGRHCSGCFAGQRKGVSVSGQCEGSFLWSSLVCVRVTIFCV